MNLADSSRHVAMSSHLALVSVWFWWCVCLCVVVSARLRGYSAKNRDAPHCAALNPGHHDAALKPFAPAHFDFDPNPAALDALFHEKLRVNILTSLALRVPKILYRKSCNLPCGHDHLALAHHHRLIRLRRQHLRRGRRCGAIHDRPQESSHALCCGIGSSCCGRNFIGHLSYRP